MILTLILFLLGSFIGSFLLVLATRLPEGKSPWKGRSKCDDCHHTLSPLDLLPLLSFVWLGGRCRYCRKRLSRLYPIVELATGLIFVSIAMYVFGNTLILSLEMLHVTRFALYISLLIIFSSFLVIFIADIKYQIIPDEMLVSALVGIGLYFGFQPDFLIQLANHIGSGVGACLFFLLIYLGTKGRGMGFGDVKLAFVLGLFLGFPATIVGLYIAFLTGAALSLILILIGKKKLKSAVAFGPFLIFGAVASYFIGDFIITWYLNFFH